MRESRLEPQGALRRWRLVVGLAGLVFALLACSTRAQEPDAPLPDRAETETEGGATDAYTAVAERIVPQLMSIWDLTVRGGVFMLPIGICSVVVLTFAIERRIALRKKRILPPALLSKLQKLNNDTDRIDPRQAYALCQSYPSPMANVLKAAILKIGRPYSELEKAVEDAVGREADEMSRNLRPINVSASISPLLGLLGTVQGMIMAFMVTSTTTATGAAKGQELAQGIYTALVTTFAGLCVAVPAILIAHMLEGRIGRLLRDMEDVFLELVPQLERFEGKTRVSRSVGSADKAEPAHESPAKPVESPRGKATSSTNQAAGDAVSDEEAQPVQPASKGLWEVMGTRKPGADAS